MGTTNIRFAAQVAKPAANHPEYLFVASLAAPLFLFRSEVKAARGKIWDIFFDTLLDCIYGADNL